ncbi:MAG: aspartate carbamoyltransferase catalytic subunit [Candidatus Gastranaerophilales bacterium]|nr:aspartate carbamoyltransferase catalytic subunit [Candidatus Gastranaerophilales bacterium]
MQNLIDIKSLEKDEILKIIKLAEQFEEDKAVSTCFGENLALLFCEDSTRTKFSFEMAANKLGIHIYNFDANKSSFSKGESMKDTVENLYQIGINGIVIRHSEAGIVDKTVEEVVYPMKFINAGDGNHAHPTQALLDFYTMRKHLRTVEDKKIAIIGDVRHSRVAHSNVELLSKFGANIYFCAPKYFEDATQDVIFTKSLEEALKDADIVMCLRIQKERLEERIPIFDYVHDYGLTMKKLEQFAKKDVLIMHPGPVNRDVEISSEVLDSNYGKTILEQAHNGVFVRMAVLDLLLGGKS